MFSSFFGGNRTSSKDSAKEKAAKAKKASGKSTDEDWVTTSQVQGGAETAGQSKAETRRKNKALGALLGAEPDFSVAKKSKADWVKFLSTQAV